MKQTLFRLLSSFPRPAWWLVALGCWCGVFAGEAQAQNGNTLLTAFPLGTLTSTLTRTGLVNNADARDYYQFTVTGPVREVVVSIASTSLVADIRLSLLWDLNHNNQDDPSDLLIAGSSNFRFGQGASVSLWLESGTYFVKVERAGSVATPYQLSLSQTPHPSSPGVGDNSLVTARPLNTGQATNDFVGITDTADYYRFEVIGQVTEVTATVPANSLTADIGLSLLRNFNGTGIEEPLVSSSSNYRFGTDATTWLWLSPGTYYVKVSTGPGANTRYALTLTQTPRPYSPGTNDNGTNTARFLPTGTPTNDFVGVTDAVDFYRFQVFDQVTEVNVTVPPFSLTADVSLSLINSVGVPLSSSSSNYRFGQSAAVWSWVEPGLYFVRVQTTGGNTTYEISLGQIPHPESPGIADNTYASSRVLTPGRPVTDFLGVSDQIDYYRFSVAGSGTPVSVAIPASSLSADLRLTLLLPTGQELGNSSSNFRFGQNAVVTRTLNAGNYFVRVQPGSASVNTLYTIGLAANGQDNIPVINVSTSLLAFGSVQVGGTATRTLTIRNLGTANLNVSSLTYPSGFSGAFSGSIAPDGSQEMTVTFAPSAAGNFGGTATVNSDAKFGLNMITVSGTGTPIPTRVIKLPASLTFGEVETNRAATRMLVISNAGNSLLTVTGINFPAGFSGDFAGTIPPKGAQPVAVTFTPDALTNYTGTVTVFSDATSGTNTTAASGRGVPMKQRTIGLRGDLAFGGVESGRSSNRVLVITNSGDASFTVSNIVYPGGFSGAFTGQVPARASRSVVVKFSPPSTLDYNGVVEVITDANGGTNTIGISGTGTPILPRVIGLGGNLAFGEVQARSNATRILFITNSGVAALAVSGISYPTGFSGAFSGNIPAGGVRSVRVKFKPETAGSYTGLVTVLSDKNSGENMRAISGTARPAPLRAREGTYQGVFQEIRDWVHASSGFFTLTLAKGGASYSGKILLDGQVWSISGKFDFDGNASNLILRKGRDSILMEWHADPEGGDQITGLIGVPDNWAALLLGRRAVYALKPNDAPQAGRYTMLLGVIPGADYSPQGDGFGTVTVSARGVITLAGTLADGTKVTQATTLSREGDWPLYISLYKGGGGSLQGSPVFASPPGRDLSASGKWFRPAMIKTIYPAGFAVETAINGSRYVAPIGKTNRVVAISNALVRLTGGSFASMMDFPVLLSANNKVVNESLQKLSMRIDTSTGLFSGSVTPDGAKTALPFQGVFLQSSNPIGYGAGYFLRENLSGRIEFKIAP